MNNAKICENVFHKTKYAFVKVNNTATNVATKSKKIQSKANFQNGRHKISGKKNLENNSKKKFRTGDNPHKCCLAIPHPTSK